MTFDPTHDKISDQPVTIGGDKSAAAWHGSDGATSRRGNWHPDFRCTACGTACRTSDVLAKHKQDCLHFLRAERDALAAKIKLAHNACDRCEGSGWINPTIDDAMPCDAPLHDALATAPAVSLALHDAEVFDQGWKACQQLAQDQEPFAQVQCDNPYRAAAIREEAK